MKRRFTDEQRERVLRAARDYKQLRIRERSLDVVDLAYETDNYFWSHLTDRQARVACRLITWGEEA